MVGTLSGAEATVLRSLLAISSQQKFSLSVLVGRLPRLTATNAPDGSKSPTTHQRIGHLRPEVGLEELGYAEITIESR